ncbi:MAG: DNA-directed RNA polymerase subunit D [Candidatus Korarchaeota archaeon]|nr:DNA-directed RNA polymerase subunit D [Candidatus Korarchaeota archaeon]
MIEDAPLGFVNAIRRLSESSVPVMAIDEVMFLENNSAMYDEIIAHRLGLIPLSSEKALEKYKRPEECAVDPNQPECYTILHLEAEAKAEECGDQVCGEPVVVYSGDLVSEDPDVKPVYEDMPIAYLAPGQKIALEARARLGRGSEHAKWMPGIAVSRYLPIIEYDAASASSEQLDECIKCVSGGSGKVEEALRSRGRGAMELLDDINTSIYDYCARESCRGILRTRRDEKRLILKVESTGALPPEHILLEASRILEEKAEALLEDINRLTQGDQP